MHPRDVTYIIHAFIDLGVIRKVLSYNKQQGRATVYKVRPEWLREVYTNTDIIYLDIDRAISGKHKSKHTINTSDPEYSTALQKVNFYWDTARAFELILKLPPELQGKKWESICNIPHGDDLHCSWNQKEWGYEDGGRVYTMQINFQGTPKEWRIDGVFCDTSTHVVEVDFTAEHINMLLHANGIEPSAELWSDLQGKSGLSKDVLKGALNPMICNQKEYGYVYRRREAGDKRNALEITQDRTKAIDALLSLGVKRDTINSIEYMQQGAKIMQEIVKETARQGLPCMPLHDGVLCRGPESIRGNLIDIFTQSSEAILGTALPSR